jgi:hypothetical protein
VTRIAKILVCGFTIAVVALSSAPAFAGPSARNLPSGQALYSPSCDGVYFTDQLAQLNPLDATATAVGNSPLGTCFSQAAWDPANGTAYVINNGLQHEALASVNVTTGVITNIANFLSPSEAFINVDGLSISPSGVAYVENSGSLYTVNLSNAQLSNPVPLVDGSSNPYFGLSAMAFNPVDGELYAIAKMANMPEISINPTTGLVTVISTNAFSGLNASALQFDSSGTAWIVVAGAGVTTYLYSGLFSNLAGTEVLQGPITYNGNQIAASSDLITPTVPAAPVSATATGGNGQATVSWTASPGATSYSVTASPGGGTCTANSPSTSCTVTGLTNGAPYSFSVTASNTLGTSPAATASATPVAPATTTTTTSPRALELSTTAKLASTGAPIGSMIVGGLALILSGGLLVLLRRRSATL